MHVQVLGSGAGGGLPQWNCACGNCVLARAGDARIAARTQDSIAVASSADPGVSSLLVNASPDVLRHIEGTPRLWPRAPRDTPIGAIVLTNGDLDHVVGLLSLRESQPLRILATPRVRAGLTEHNAFLRTLARTPDQVTWVDLALGREVALGDLGLGVTAMPAPGKLPVHLTGVLEPSPQDNVALRVRDLATGRVAVIATALGGFEPVVDLVAGADAVLFDGTFWSEDELVALGLGRAHARDMAHVPVGGPDGSLARLRLPAGTRRVYTHINNTNPMLRTDSTERAQVERTGWEIAFDGMELSV
ncbi:MAG TPA: pyrroloquinoline quinone biosynthesis protein PqqB [Polyangiaceae bacterium]|jgi:pyrroloquinoline quinone biosynthesis protein B|nr:pyrroloquinoline quinone biosynthesis protein PqqB [Polyangiaceae bacterium]